MWRRRKHHRLDLSSNPPILPHVSASSSKKTESSIPEGQFCRQFTVAEIRSFTKDFNQSLLIGRGGFWSVYKGTIKDGTRTINVAVKRWNSVTSGGALQFQTEVEICSMLRHLNIVQMIGYCNDFKERNLVFKYMSNGSLGDHLHNQHTPLSWSQRLKICIDVARALDYLYNGISGQVVIHRDVTSSNILLDDQWAAKITAFGLSKIISSDDPSPDLVTAVRGTIGYIDPVYLSTGVVSKNTDLYSFGVVLLEVLSRRRAFDLSRLANDEEPLLTLWAEQYLRAGDLEQIIDPDLKGQILPTCLKDYARIVQCCLYGHRKERITMAEVVFGLESILALQERTDNSIPQIGIATSDKRLQNYFFSSGQNSGGSYFRKDIELLSVKSDWHKDEGDRTTSWYELMQLEYIQRADVLMRMKDFLHLIWSYPMKKEAEVKFGSLLHKCSSLSEYIRKSMDSSTDENYLMEIQTLLEDAEEDLDDAAFDMVAYLPDGLVQNKSGIVGTGDDSGQVPFASFLSGVPQIHASAIDSATLRAVSCIMDLKVKKLGISGSGAEKVADSLKDMPELRRAFDMVLCVQVKHHTIAELMIEIEKEINLWWKRNSITGNRQIVLDQFLNCLLFLDCSDKFIDLHEPEFNLSKWFGTVQIVMTSCSKNAYCPVDMEIRVQDHVLPWILFVTNVNLATVGKYSRIQEMATRLIEKCHGHLLGIILLARALNGVVDDGVWELALQELTSQKEEPSSPSQLGVTSYVMVRVLRFIWSRMETLSQRCIIQFASRYIGSEFDKSLLINWWIRDGSVKSEQEGKHAYEDLIRSFFLEQVGENSIRMREETRVIVLAHFVPRAYGFYLKEDGLESNKMPNIEEWDAREIHLKNNILSELPENPDCPILVNLFLHFNQDLMDIPITFFDNMPGLEVLDLSNTSIKCLPSSISKLTTLRKLFIRDCDLLMELPPEIGALKNLKVFDSEGTQLICLPEQFGSLTKLECLKFSLYNFADGHKRSNQSMQMYLASILSKLIRLKELGIYVDSYCEWWEDEVKRIIAIITKFRNLESLRLYLPTTKLLEIFMETNRWIGVPVYQQLSNFGFIVGHLQQHPISRVPHELRKTFVKLTKCLTYTNGEGDIEVIGRALKHANALFIERHWTLQSLSTFGSVETLKFCLLVECNEMREIVNESFFSGTSLRRVFGSLEHLSVHYMQSLRRIWYGSIHSGCLSNLKTLALHTCPELKTIFPEGSLDCLTCLEYLIVEDCSKINNLVSFGSYRSTLTPFLPRLKKISLLHLPALVSISSGISIAPRLESLIVYDCPNLEKLPYMEPSEHIWEIKGENEWWDGLKWCEPEWTNGQPEYMANVFIPLGTHGDIMEELADAVDLLPDLSD